MLQHDKQEAIEMYAEALESLAKLREDCAAAEAMKDKLLDEKEQLELTCAVVQSDCDMFKTRRDAVWQQLKEVEKERERLIRERNDAQVIANECMEDKTKYRAQIRSLEEKYDNMNQVLLQRDRELCQLKSNSNRPTCAVPWKGNEKYISPPTGSLSTSTASSNDQVDNLPVGSDVSSESEHFRDRLYVTKYYKKYLTKLYSNIKLGNFGKDCRKVFPDIELAANYGPGDGEFKRLSEPIMRRKGARHGRSCTTRSETESVTSTSNG
uniref:Uncharacterized protein n=2 Tax=Ciona savignyi TaxID=51511 RepID=H2ZQ40_CIOSA